MALPQQLTLRLKPREQTRLEDFIVGENRLLLQQLQLLCRGEGEPFLYIWGGEGSGRSHLLQGCCHRADDLGIAVFYLPLAEPLGLTPEVLKGLEQFDLLCLDDLQAVAGKAEWEQALFHLYNRLRDGGKRLLVSADRSPAALPLRLPDLASRLSWGLSFQLQPLDEAGRLQMLIAGARRRDMHISEETAAYLLKRCPRDPHSLEQLLDRLDQASLRQKRKVTIPFVRELLQDADQS